MTYRDDTESVRAENERLRAENAALRSRRTNGSTWLMRIAILAATIATMFLVRRGGIRAEALAAVIGFALTASVIVTERRE